MGMMSAAEARLDADIRPEITVLRSRSPYPTRRRSADSARRATGSSAGETTGRPLAAVPVPVPVPVPAPSSPRPATRPAPRPGPIRLTRRGRIVVAVLIVIAAVGVAGLVWLAVAGQAQASGQVTPRQSGGQGMLRVVVQPGQTLWSIAVRAEPTADPRVVVQQIIDANSLASPAIEPGEVLRVPRD